MDDASVVEPRDSEGAQAVQIDDHSGARRGDDPFAEAKTIGGEDGDVALHGEAEIVPRPTSAAQSAGQSAAAMLRPSRAAASGVRARRARSTATTSTAER